jgi:hypothetical protein
MQIIEEIKGKSYYIFSPDPTARMPDWGGLTMAQNCLTPNGPPKLDTVNVPPCSVYQPSNS